jgi:hypothetical protein
MAGLASLEDDFQRFLLSGADGIQMRVIGTKKVPIDTRLTIYGDGYRARLIEALEAHYPALLALLGKEEFANLGDAYVRAHDSNFASIRFYGGTLAAFLTTHAEHRSTPLRAELARWEWAMSDVFDAADAACIDVAALGRIAPHDWAELKFELHPAMRRVDLNWNVPSFWKALTQGEPPPAPAATAAPVAWLLWRQELQIFFRPLSNPEAQALEAVRCGASFGELCVALCATCSDEEAPARAAGFLREWVESGLVVGTQAREA